MVKMSIMKDMKSMIQDEMEKYREEDRKEEAEQVSLSESQKFQEELEPIKEGACVIGEARKDREEVNPKIKELEVALANALAVNESHQKLNGKLQERLTELEEENKKLYEHVDKQVDGARKSGM
jgi:hypothetical protein